ncbi:outer membrane protein H1 [Vibrio astriarenae]|nr:outer membrane protein H1 [Vibrio sp. C7]
MKLNKIITLALLSSVAAAPALAVDAQWFVGAGVGYQDDSIKGINQNGEDATYQLRGGAILDDNHRLMATYGYMDKNDQHMFLGSYDYLYPLSDNVNFVAGASMGTSKSKIDNKSSTDFVWGGQVGVMYEFNSNVSTEIMYRYLDQDYKENDIKLTDSQQIVWSVDYRF